MAEVLLGKDARRFAFFDYSGFIGNEGECHLEVYLLSQSLVTNSSQIRILVRGKGGSRFERLFEKDIGNKNVRKGIIDIKDIKDSVALTEINPLDAGNTILRQHYQHNSWAILLDKVYQVNHSDDGSLSTSVSVLVESHNSEYSTDRAGSRTQLVISLPRIAREPSLTLPNRPVFGSNVVVAIGKKDSSFRHKVRYRIFEEDWVDVGTNFDTSASFTVPIAWLSKIPDSRSAPVTISVQTFQNGKTVGWDTQKIVYFEVPDSAVPTIGTISVVDTNSKVYNRLGANNYLRHISQPRVTVSDVKGVYGSTIKSYQTTILGQTINKNPATFTQGFDRVGTVAVVCEVVDSRGMVGRKTVSMTLTDYYLPTISAFLPARSGEGTNKAIQAAIVASAKPVLVANANKNGWTVIIEWSERNRNQWTQSYLANVSVEQFSQTVSAGNVFDQTKSYDIRLTVSDQFSQQSSIVTVSTLKATMVLGADGVGIGKSPEPGRNLDVSGNVHATNDYHLNGKPIQHHQLTQNNASAIVASGDWNNYVQTGFYRGARMANQPTGTGCHDWKYVKVTRHDDGWILQEAVDFNGIASFYRVKVGGNWQPWRKLLREDNHNLPKYALVSDSGSIKSMVSGNWNDQKDSGFYYGLQLENAPKNGSWYVMVMRNPIGYILQEAYSDDGQKHAFRTFKRDVWTPWKLTTDYVISDNGSNGSYIKMEDGTLICRHTVQDSRYLQNGYTTRGDVTWTFPFLFVGDYTVTATIVSPTKINITPYQIVTKSASSTKLTTYDKPYSGTWQVDLVAIGRWK